MIQELIIATNNNDKLKEIVSILNFNIKIIPITCFPNCPIIVEDGKTLEENAIKKAKGAAIFLRQWVLADDSGLEVNCLNGLPGVHSARFAGQKCSYNDNNKKLLRLLKYKKNREATFKTVIAIANPYGQITLVFGKIFGKISNMMKGINGFGYDSVFYLPNYGKTLAELSPTTKNLISHRAKALKKTKKFIKNNILKI
ncbi:MAG: RdgB/HAM1 family non-canonical purine NTP pyrophosphatase [Endomicrobium sp.]|jgi:XTP/dITP diphosphohydrolase|nr:RdgB/HAM1 family non-canonical purine NTP pyrophosphatase [Endomicrobium sp.]